jgi:hypothetical protein
VNKCDENMRNIFERKILRKIFGALREHGTIMNCKGYTENNTYTHTLRWDECDGQDM